MEIEVLENKLPEHIYKILIKVNFDSIKSILLRNRIDIQQITELNFQDVDLLIDTISEIYVGNKIKNAFEIPRWSRISTGCTKLDNLLHGGIPINGINEIYGESGVGKTQFCLQLALMVQLPVILGGLEKNAVYICTEDPFPSKRLKQLTEIFLRRFNSTKEININFEDNIFVEHIVDSEQLRICLYVKLAKLIREVNIGIIIIDSIAGVFRTYNENYQSRSEDFLMISRKLYELSSEKNIAIICTNQVTDNLETGQMNPCLGLAWSNLVTCRFCISRPFNSLSRNLQVTFAPDLPCSSCNFFIKESGIIDED